MELSARERLIALVGILLLFDGAFLLDIPILREVLGAAVIAVIPGMLILSIVRPGKITLLEYCLLAVGASIAFLMIGGLLYNNLLMYLGITNPFTGRLLLDFYNLAIIVLAAAWYLTNNDRSFSLPDVSMKAADMAFLLPGLIFPSLSVLGMHQINTAGNNLLLLGLLIAVLVYIAALSICHAKVSPWLLPAAILLLSVTLILPLALRSNYIIGTDSHFEYFTFITTLENAHWSIIGSAQLDSCLSISILPSVFQIITGVPPMMLFKVLFALIFSISPLIVYSIAKQYLAGIYAFLAAAFFMIQPQFMTAASNSRTVLALLFFMLTIMLLLNEGLNPARKKVLVVLFIAAAIFSHYSTSFIFFGILVFAWVGTGILSLRYPVRPAPSFDILVIFLALMYVWYALVTVVPSQMFLEFIDKTIENLDQFLMPGTRGEDVQRLFGAQALNKGFPYVIQLALSWVGIGLIAIGSLAVALDLRRTVLPGRETAEYLENKFSGLFFVLVIIVTGLLGLMVVVPYVSDGYDLARVLPLSNTILSVMFVVGGIAIAEVLRFVVQSTGERREHLTAHHGGDRSLLMKMSLAVILVVLLPYFLSVTGVLHTLYGDHRDVVFHADGPQYDMKYVHETEAQGAVWLNQRMDPEMRVFADGFGISRLMSLGTMPPSSLASFVQYGWVSRESYVYLRHKNVVDGNLIDFDGKYRDMDEFAQLFRHKSKVYANGGATIWTG
ncbi:MAG: DUF2206 domain-containing protein [Methanofollis sp.]|uniref:DUF2206 domain-containing protein n=1 Tax=Methanofollis sp. TaxID=2052835 RepID=UPI00260FFAA3|nr:DUF2206 domain-containing protein [Methanofollis sp.]MDD4255255.1 DUF2206 domain-containing protein [Methanofollis sp.]